MQVYTALSIYLYIRYLQKFSSLEACNENVYWKTETAVAIIYFNVRFYSAKPFLLQVFKYFRIV